jgi:hypothetical protein
MKPTHWHEGMRFRVLNDPQQVFHRGVLITLHDVIGDGATAEVDEVEYREIHLNHFLLINGEVVMESREAVRRRLEFATGWLQEA